MDLNISLGWPGHCRLDCSTDGSGRRICAAFFFAGTFGGHLGGSHIVSDGDHSLKYKRICQMNMHVIFSEHGNQSSPYSILLDIEFIDRMQKRDDIYIHCWLYTPSNSSGTVRRLIYAFVVIDGGKQILCLLGEQIWIGTDGASEALLDIKSSKNRSSGPNGIFCLVLIRHQTGKSGRYLHVIHVDPWTEPWQNSSMILTPANCQTPKSSQFLVVIMIL